MKKCTKCSSIKDNSCFTKSARSRDGLSYWCKECQAANRRARASSLVGRHRTCNGCHDELPPEAFHKNAADPLGIQRFCKKCSSARQKAKRVPKPRKSRVLTATGKKCPSCKKNRPLSDFHKDSSTRTGLSSWCKECKNPQYYLKVKGQKNRGLKVGDAKVCLSCGKTFSWGGSSSSCPACAMEYERLRVFKRHGITESTYLSMYEDQGRVCAICKVDKPKMCIDHDHSCCPGNFSCGGCIRGIICSNCNSAIGFISDNLNTAVAMVKYLSK